MANTVSTISYANTFGQWMVATDALIAENNILAAADYTKDSGTLYLSETTKNALQSNGNIIVQKQLIVQGVGSSATVDNNLTVAGQVYFSNTTLGLTNSGQANINGLLVAQGPGIGLSVANNAYIGGNTTIRYNTITNTVQANSSVNTANASITGTTYTKVLQANTSTNTATASVTGTTFTDILQANSSVNTTTASIVGTTFTDVLQSNTSTNTATASVTGTTFTDILQANTSTNTATASVTGTTFTNVLQANTSTNTATASVTGTTFTRVLQANTSINTPIISVSNSVITNDIQANNVIGAPILLGNTITGNISVTTPTLTVSTLLDGNAAAAFVNSLQVQGGGLTVNGNFTLTGTTVYASNTFQLSTGATSGITSYLQAARGSSGVNAAIRWSEPSLYWETLDVTGNIYSRIITENYLANQTGSSANSAFLKANSAYDSQNTTGTYANSAYTQANTATNNAAGASLYANGAFRQANAAYGSQNTTGTYANSAYTQANTATNNAAGASLYANGAFIQANASFRQANAAYVSQNTTGTYANSAYTQANTATNNAAGASQYANSAFTKANNAVNFVVGTTGTISPSSGVISFTSNNGLTAVATTANNLAISTSQDLQTTASPTFTGATFSLPVVGTTMAAGTSNTAFATTAYVQNLANNSGTLTTNITGNAGTVTNGVYTNGSYANPSWITSIANTKITGVMTASQLAATAVTVGTYGGSTQHAVVTVDQQGRITFAANATPSISNTQITGTITNAQLGGGITSDKISTLSSSLVTTALGYTPYNSTNPSGYLTSSGTIDNATTATNVTNALGKSQTYSNLAGSRSSGTNYTNSTSKPIWVWYSADSATGGATTTAYVDSNIACKTIMDLYPRAFAGFIVPAGSTYSISCGGNINVWLELR